MLRIALVWLMGLLPSISLAEEETGGGDTGGGGSIFTWPYEWIVGKINAVIAVVNAFIQNMWNTIVDFFDQLYETAYDMLTDVLIRFFSMGMDLIITIVQGLDSLFQQIDVTNLLSDLPPEVINMMGLIGLGKCLGLIGIAITIRITMQLIPFVRLGS